MTLNKFFIKDSSGKNIHICKWTCDVKDPIGVIQLSHGMAEHALRYAEFANYLNDNGYIVYANDHRGHGRTSPDELGYMGEGDAFHLMVNNLKDVTDLIKSENPNLPIFLLGHSMGSFLSLRYAELFGNGLDGLILCGTNGNQPFIFSFGEKVAKYQMKKHGAKTAGTTMDKLSFGNFNNNFKPNRTNFDWLCSDEKEVDKYIEDPLCGTIHSNSYFYYLLKGLRTNQKKENLDKIPKNLPILLIAGQDDPVGLMGKGVTRLYNDLKTMNIKSVDMILYPGARHEILNEAQKHKVFNDCVNFFNKNNTNCSTEAIEEKETIFDI